MSDFLAFDPNNIEKEVPELIPEGEQIFFIYNMWFGKFNPNPSGARRAGDFSVPLFVKFVHKDTGLFLSRLDNEQREPFNRMLFVKRVGNINTLNKYYKFMKAIGAPEIKATGGVVFHVWRDGKKIFTPHDDPEQPGPLGLPVKLMIVHKEVPVLVPKEGAEKNQWGRYDETDLMPKLDEDGKPIKQIREFIVVDEPEDDSFKSLAESGWPIIIPLTEEEKKLRGQYFKPEEEIQLPDDEIVESPDIEW